MPFEHLGSADAVRGSILAHSQAALVEIIEYLSDGFGNSDNDAEDDDGASPMRDGIKIPLLGGDGRFDQPAKPLAAPISR